MDAVGLAAMVVAWWQFRAGGTGGPREWWDANPGKCMVSLHAPLGVTRETARQWAEAMRRAIADSGTADADVASALADVLDSMATGMARR
eukprot:gene25261-31458_t